MNVATSFPRSLSPTFVIGERESRGMGRESGGQGAKVGRVAPSGEEKRPWIPAYNLRE